MNIREEETTMNIQDLFNERNEQNKRITELVLKLEKQKEVLNKIKEYITSYESINTIQGCETPEKNIGLDKETFIEMINRYMKVHDKILELLEEIDSETRK